MGLDLVEVADQADPPVCRIMDYGKFKYEQSQRAKESRKKATHVLVKEMKYRPKIGPGDFDTKTRKVEQFLGDGSKVKVTIMFRGREMQHPELGRRILDRVAETVDHVGRVEVFPKQDGRNMIMVLVPGQGTRRQREAAADRREADVQLLRSPTRSPIRQLLQSPTRSPIRQLLQSPIRQLLRQLLRSPTRQLLRLSIRPQSHRPQPNRRR